MMRKESVIARIKAAVQISGQTAEWLSLFDNAWFARDEGRAFLTEFGRRWDSAFIESTEPLIQRYFSDLGIPEDVLPRIEITESHPGSWIIEAVVVMAGSVGTAYTLLKGASELPQIADGLEELKGRLRSDFQRNANDVAKKGLATAIQRSSDVALQQQAMVVPLPPSVVSVDYYIDAGPLRALQPDATLVHKTHISVGISRSGFVLENLSEDEMRDVRIGIFMNRVQQHQWSIGDAYTASIGLLSGRQTTTKNPSDFRRQDGTMLSFADPTPLYVDCWIQDVAGIHLFMFLLS